MEKPGIEFRSFEARCISTTWEVFFLISLYLVPLPLFIAQGSLNSAIFLSKYRSCKRPSCNDPAVTVAAIINRHQTKHNYAFRDLWNC